MKIVVDLNIWIDIVARPKTYSDSVAAFRKMEKRGDRLCFPLSGYTTVYYILSRALTPKAALDYLTQIQDRGIRMLPFGPQEVAVAQSLNFKDHEDACIAAAAIAGKCDCIVTRNSKDFGNALIQVHSPKQILSWPETNSN